MVGLQSFLHTKKLYVCHELKALLPVCLRKENYLYGARLSSIPGDLHSLIQLMMTIIDFHNLILCCYFLYLHILSFFKRVTSDAFRMRILA